jgi:hypothetical protein
VKELLPVADRRYVRPNSEGGWDVLKEGHRRTTVRADTRRRALARARDLARRDGGGEILVLDRMGKVVEADTVRARRAPSRRAA